MATPSTTPNLGVASEVGTLRSVIVHRPDLAHERLSPTNCHELLFDDVIWTRRARQEHDAFVDLMRERGAEVLLFHELLTETLEDRAAREWVLERKLRPEEVTTIFARELTAWMTEMPADELATRLTGGVTLAELPEDIVTAVGRAMRPTDFVLRPLPNQLFMRDTSAWIYGGVSINAMFWPAPPARDAQPRGGLPLPPALPRRRLPDLVRRRRPRLGQRLARGRRHHARGRRRRPRRPGRALERARGEHPRREPVRRRRARLVIGAQMPRERAAMHLDTVFTFCDRHVATLYEPVVSQIVPILYTPDGDGGVGGKVSDRSFLDEVKDALGLEDLKLVPTGGDEFEAERNQWDDGNNVVALSPGTVVAYERNEATNAKLAKAGVEVLAIAGPGARPRPRRRPLHDLPDLPRRLKGHTDDHRHRAPRRRRRPARPPLPHAATTTAPTRSAT